MIKNNKTNQLNRELKRLEAKETDASLLHVRELRGRKVNEKSQMPPIRQPSPGLTCVHGATQNLKTTTNFLPPQ